MISKNCMKIKDYSINTCNGLSHILFAVTFLSNARTLTLKGKCDFFIMVEEKFEIQSYQMPQINPKK